MITCNKCGTELEIKYNQYRIKKLYEFGRVDVLHDFLACIDKRKSLREQRNEPSEQEQIIQDNRLEIGYKTLHNTVNIFPKSEPKIYAVRGFLSKNKNYPDYNRTKIEYHFCFSCNKETEHSPIKEVKNVIKCLICTDIKLSISKQKSRGWCGKCRQHKKVNGECHC